MFARKGSLILMDTKGLKDIAALIKATEYSLAGLRSAWNNESAFRTECVLTLIMIPAGLWIGETAVQKALLVLTCLMVLTVELLNSAIEAVVDRLGKDYHPLSKRAKDMGSAAVFISLIATLAAWLIIIVARFL